MPKKFKKLKKHDFNRTLTELENDDWGKAENTTSLVETCHKLRHKPLNKFDAEDLRIMIGQNISLPYLIPLAIKLLEANPLVSGDCYEGDLLLSVMKAEKQFYDLYPELKEEVKLISEGCRNELLNNSVLRKDYIKIEEVFNSI